MEILKRAETDEVSGVELHAMQSSWDTIFSAFQRRREVLTEIWEQQNVDVSQRLDLHGGGIFKRWYTKVSAST